MCRNPDCATRDTCDSGTGARYNAHTFALSIRVRWPTDLLRQRALVSTVVEDELGFPYRRSQPVSLLRSVHPCMYW